MIEIVVTMAITFLVLSVLVPLALTYLLVRQVVRGRTVGWLLWRRRHRGADRPRGSRPAMPALSRPWSVLAADAAAARNRFVGTLDQLAPGPLKDALSGAVAEVDAAVADAQRLAAEGSATDRAHRQVLAALEQQRRRSRRAPQAPSDVAASLAAATHAQKASAQRLGESSRQTLCQLQLVVARLHELTAHSLELTTMNRASQALQAASSIADRVAALRQATAELDERAIPVAL